MNLSFIKVTSRDLKEECHRVRYEVFCGECGFLPAENYPEGMEIDVYDPHSVHFAAFADDYVIGTSRLVTSSDVGYPLSRFCKDLFIDEADLPVDRLVEVSRLALRKSFRRRKEDGLYGIESYLPKSQGGILPEKEEEKTELERRRRPLIIMGLYKVMYQEALRMGMTHAFAAMEIKLWHALKSIHFTFQAIGPEVDYHGPVTPYLGILEEMGKEMHDNAPELWSFMLEGLEEEYWPSFMQPAGCDRNDSTNHHPADIMKP